MPSGSAHSAQVALEDNGRSEHDHDSDEPQHRRLGEECDEHDHTEDERRGRPLAVAAGMALDGLRADTLGEFGVLLDEGLLEFRQYPLFMLRERHDPHPPNSGASLCPVRRRISHDDHAADIFAR